MKKILGIFLSAFLMVSAVSAAFAETSWVEAKRNIMMPAGSSIANVIMVDGVTFIPLDSLTFFMNWTEFKKSGSDNRYFGTYDKSIYMCVFPNSNKALLNDKEITMPVAAFMHKDQLYVPLSFICKALGNTVLWRADTNTIYIQSPEETQKANDIIINSLTAVSQQKKLKTTYNNKTSMLYYADNYALESKGEMKVDLLQNVAHDLYTSNLFNERYAEYNRKPESTTTRESYVTANGIYELKGSSYVKGPVPPENISTMDMASKSILTDYELFLNSASVSKDGNGDYAIKSKTNVGVLMSTGFHIYLPEEAKSLEWRDSYQTITYDKTTFLPKKMELSLYASYIPDPKFNEKMSLHYTHQYLFDFTSDFHIVLPVGVQ